MGDALDARTFESRYRDLTAEFARERGNTACIECERCQGCSNSTFCKDSERLLRCHFCVRCQSSSDSLHCRNSKGLIGCQHCVECESCSSSSYLIKSIGLSGCSYCFGCVGLANKDFCILNEPYSRRDYFALVAKLTKELRIG